MTADVRSVPSADAQAEAADEWWRTNRTSAPELFVRELRAATDLLAESPDIGQRVRHRAIRNLRRVLLPATRYHVYYTHAPAGRAVLILSIWSAVRGRRPRLKGP